MASKKTTASLSTADPSKRLLSDSSSLVDLKAEVFRKHQEAKFNRLHGKATPGVVSTSNKDKKEQIWSKKNAGLTAREKKDLARSEEERRDEARVREALERKAKLYDKLKEGGGRGGDDVDDDRFLVNFNRQEGSDDSDEDLRERFYPAADEGERWVEYTDSLGRTRTCMKKDLEELKRRDRELSVDVAGRGEGHEGRGGRVGEVGEDMDLLSEDMRRELLRQKWEKEEEENLKKRNVHYQDVLFDEARTHGAGFYRFSKDEATRAGEQEELERLHKETELAREKAEDDKTKRRRAMAARLKKVKDKKRLRMGLPLLDSDSEKEEEKDGQELKDVEEEKETSLEEGVMESLRVMRKEREEEEREARRRATVREWDRGKDGVSDSPAPASSSSSSYSLAHSYGMKGEKRLMDQKEWVTERRKERKNEFAPPSAYEPLAKKSNKVEPTRGPPRSLDSLYGRKRPGSQQQQQQQQQQSQDFFSRVPPPPTTSFESATRPNFSSPPPGYPKASRPAPPATPSAPPPPPGLDPMSELNSGLIGPAPRPEERKKEPVPEDGDGGGEEEVLAPVSIGDRLKMFRDAVDASGVTGPREDGNAEAKGAEIAPPCSMDYYSSGRPSSSSDTSGFRSRRDMSISFQVGMSSRRPLKDNRSAVSKDTHRAFRGGGGADVGSGDSDTD